MAGADWISDEVFSAAAAALAGAVTDEELAAGLLYPAVGRLREVTHRVAVVVLEQTAREGHGRAPERRTAAEKVTDAMWTAEYPELVAARKR